MLSTKLSAVDILTSDSTLEVEVVSYVSTQEPTAEGSPIADHV